MTNPNPTADLTPATMLAIHNDVWDMPTLASQFPTVLDWISARYSVEFGMASEVIVFDNLGGGIVKLPAYVTNDVREAVQAILAIAAGQTVEELEAEYGPEFVGTRESLPQF